MIPLGFPVTVERADGGTLTFDSPPQRIASINLTKSMAKAIGHYNIRVNAIAPGVTMTEATKGLVPPPILESLINASALKTTLEPSDLAGTALFLASEDSALITGQVLVVDGGLVMLG